MFFLIDRLLILFLRKLIASLFFSTKVTFSAPLDIASNPKDPTPEYRSKILEFLSSTLINLECKIILKIFSFTESFKGLVSGDFKNIIGLPLNLPPIILIFF